MVTVPPGAASGYGRRRATRSSRSGDSTWTRNGRVAACPSQRPPRPPSGAPSPIHTGNTCDRRPLGNLPWRRPGHLSVRRPGTDLEVSGGKIKYCMTARDTFFLFGYVRDARILLCMALRSDSQRHGPTLSSIAVRIELAAHDFRPFRLIGFTFTTRYWGLRLSTCFL